MMSEGEARQVDARRRRVLGRGCNTSSRACLARAGIRVVRAERKRYTEEMRLARQLGKVWWGLRAIARIWVTLSEMQATEPLSLGQAGTGSLLRLLPFR